MTPRLSIANVDAGHYQAFAVNGDRDPFGAVQLLHAADGAPDRLLFGIWRCPPLSVELTPRLDEGVYVLHGALTLGVDDAEPARLAAGDFVVVRSGSRCRYTIVEDLTAVFAAAPPPPER